MGGSRLPAGQAQVRGASGSGRDNRRRRRTRSVTSSCVGTTARTREKCGPACDSSSAHETGDRSKEPSQTRARHSRGQHVAAIRGGDHMVRRVWGPRQEGAGKTHGATCQRLRVQWLLYTDTGPGVGKRQKRPRRRRARKRAVGSGGAQSGHTRKQHVVGQHRIPGTSSGQWDRSARQTQAKANRRNCATKAAAGTLCTARTRQRPAGVQGSSGRAQARDA